MLRTVSFLFMSLLPGAAVALCEGQDLIDAMTADDRAALQAEADAMPYPQGLYWQATRGDQTITMFGTYHFRHARTDAHLELVKADIDRADAVYLEMSQDEQTSFQNAIARDPGIMFITEGPTLPDLLGEDDWAKFKSEMETRGFPGIMASRLKPLWAAMMLGIGPCEAQNGAMEGDGIDALVGQYAETQGTPSRSLEDFKSVLGMLDGQPMDDQLDMIRLTLDVPLDPDDMSYTIRERYLAEDIALTWQFAKTISLQYGGPTAAEDFAFLEEAILVARNEEWVELLVGLDEDDVFAAFGAGHLPGTFGVLYLLEQEGYTITRLPVPVPN
ncbi:MAG: TraB/GumN family protein [Pseudomonadota bacterium]